MRRREKKEEEHCTRKEEAEQWKLGPKDLWQRQENEVHVLKIYYSRTLQSWRVRK